MQIPSIRMSGIETVDDRCAMIAEALRLHDPETIAHGLRVCSVVSSLSRAMNLDDTTRRILAKASALHDVGKLAFDTDFIHAPWSYTPEERIRMQSHASVGSQLLDIADPDEFREIALIVFQHHERWDGTGYPRAIRGEGIHRLARLVSIADVFDALTSKRAYRQPWPEERIRAHFLENRARQFEPDLVDLFLESYAECASARESTTGV
jgi:response regulator RpfG family c-di-GMP phosphodiesterase